MTLSPSELALAAFVLVTCFGVPAFLVTLDLVQLPPLRRRYRVVRLWDGKTVSRHRRFSGAVARLHRLEAGRRYGQAPRFDVEAGR